MTAEDDSEAYWRQPKPIVVKKYSLLAAVTSLLSHRLYLLLSFQPLLLIA